MGDIEEEKTAVRRTSRARKVNPRFATGDIDESYMKLVGRITANNFTANKNDGNANQEVGCADQIFLSDASGGNKIKIKTLKLKKLKVPLSKTLVGGSSLPIDEQNIHCTKPVQCERVIPDEIELKLAKVLNLPTISNAEMPANNCTFSKRACDNYSEVIHKKAKTEDDSKLNSQVLMGQKIKIVSIKFPADMKTAFSPKLQLPHISFGNDGPVSLKLVKSPVHISPKSVISDTPSFANIFSSDGEDDIPLNKLFELNSSKCKTTKILAKNKKTEGIVKKKNKPETKLVKIKKAKQPKPSRVSSPSLKKSENKHKIKKGSEKIVKNSKQFKLKEQHLLKQKVDEVNKASAKSNDVNKSDKNSPKIKMKFSGLQKSIKKHMTNIVVSVGDQIDDYACVSIDEQMLSKKKERELCEAKSETGINNKYVISEAGLLPGINHSFVLENVDESKMEPHEKFKSVKASSPASFKRKNSPKVKKEADEPAFKRKNSLSSPKVSSSKVKNEVKFQGPVFKRENSFTSPKVNSSTIKKEKKHHEPAFKRENSFTSPKVNSSGVKKEVNLHEPSFKREKSFTPPKVNSSGLKKEVKLHEPASKRENSFTSPKVNSSKLKKEEIKESLSKSKEPSKNTSKDVVSCSSRGTPHFKFIKKEIVVFETALGQSENLITTKIDEKSKELEKSPKLEKMSGVSDGKKSNKKERRSSSSKTVEKSSEDLIKKENLIVKDEFKGSNSSNICVEFSISSPIIKSETKSSPTKAAKRNFEDLIVFDDKEYRKSKKEEKWKLKQKKENKNHEEKTSHKDNEAKVKVNPTREEKDERQHAAKDIKPEVNSVKEERRKHSHPKSQKDKSSKHKSHHHKSERHEYKHKHSKEKRRDRSRECRRHRRSHSVEEKFSKIKKEYSESAIIKSKRHISSLVEDSSADIKPDIVVDKVHISNFKQENSPIDSFQTSNFSMKKEIEIEKCIKTDMSETVIDETKSTLNQSSYACHIDKKKNISTYELVDTDTEPCTSATENSSNCLNFSYESIKPGSYQSLSPFEYNESEEKSLIDEPSSNECKQPLPSHQTSDVYSMADEHSNTKVENDERMLISPVNESLGIVDSIMDETPSDDAVVVECNKRTKPDRTADKFSADHVEDFELYADSIENVGTFSSPQLKDCETDTGNLAEINAPEDTNSLVTDEIKPVENTLENVPIKANIMPLYSIPLSVNASSLLTISSPSTDINSENFMESPELKVENSSSESINSSPENEEKNISLDILLPTLSPESEKEKIRLAEITHKETEAKNKKVVDQRMKSFKLLDENLYLVGRSKNKRSKEARRMVCDCFISKEEYSNGDMGCGDDCLNKLLMIECGSRCPLGSRCMNKHFQKKNYAGVEVFNAEKKGCGIRAKSDISAGTFLMEYIGEVFDTREFKRRRKEYAKDSSAHFYFMALQADRLIDATRKGNISRFVNHSCSPNAETQKWTVNGEVRIGFFSTEFIAEGDEINFDYRLERYGREPQKCYCGTAECRGWLGESPDEKTKEEKEEDKRKELRDKRRKEERRSIFEDDDLSDEIDQLNALGLHNRQDTLNFSRLMVRASNTDDRMRLLQLLFTAEDTCRRLFLDYHGLKLLWAWMVDISSSSKSLPLKLQILKMLQFLPLTNKTQLLDSRVLTIVERWNKKATEECNAEPELPTKKSSDSESDSESKVTTSSGPSPTDTVSPEDCPTNIESDEKMKSDQENSKNKVDEKDSTSSPPDASLKTLLQMAQDLLSSWDELKEAFRIPKKERIEMMKEHERALDREYKAYLETKTDDERTQAFYDRWRYGVDRKERRRERRAKNREKRELRKEVEDDGLSKEERRERFAQKVAILDEEARQKKSQEDMWNYHVERCNLLGHDPHVTPIFDHSGQFFWDPNTSSWQTYIGPQTVLPVPAMYGANSLTSIDQMLGGFFTEGVPMNEEEALGTPEQITVQLPRKWKLARDQDGHVYFYHTLTRFTQWQIPTEDQHQKLMAQFGLNSDSESDSDISSSSDSEEFSDEDSNEDEESKETMVQRSDEGDEKMIRRGKGKRKRSSKLVQERVISPILFEDRETARRERREAKERARQEARNERRILLKPRVEEDSPNEEDEEMFEASIQKFSKRIKSSSSKSNAKLKSKGRAISAMADSSEAAKKIKENFRSHMATFIVSVLNPFRKSDCKKGRILGNDDFKYLARKLTTFVMVKELKLLPSVEDLVISDSVKHKTKDFVRKYMCKFGPVFERDPNDTKEY